MNEKLADNLDSDFKLAGLIGSMVFTADKGEDYLLTNDELKRILYLLDVLAIYKHNADLDVEKKSISDSEPKKGKWIDHSDETIEFGGTTFTPPLTCSECGKSALNESWLYCPNCGAKMEADIEQ